MSIYRPLAVWAPEPEASANPFETRLASLAHGLLYLLVIALAITGNVLSWGRVDPDTFFQIFTIPGSAG